MNKLLVICGPTATGKTKLGIQLAKKFNGEIISADSRQVYKGMDIGTGKDVENLKSVPVWGLNLVKPNQEFSVAHFVKFAVLVINDIWERKKLPIIVGGTGFWIKALIYGIESINIPPDWKLRKKLRNYDIKKLREILNDLDPQRLEKMNQSDRNNPRRLIRAIEIKKNPSPRLVGLGPKKLKIDELLMIGLKATDYRTLYKKIDERVDKRIKQGIEKEVKLLIDQGYLWNSPSFSACGYQIWKEYFEKKKTLAEIIQRWKYDEHSLARRQLNFFKKENIIYWFDINDQSFLTKIENIASRWYSKK